MKEELIQKAKEAKSAEELLALARENSIELTEEQAKACFARLHPAAGELTDDELDAVAGGGCGGDGGTRYEFGYVEDAKDLVYDIWKMNRF